ncbi:prion-inhibition and propagation-domain-containing protein [Tricladium varicosporioides]|nr:prion-inhibition and propagation-domain-containing protein [Hymenoscyphus varicosporioides]
MDVAAAAAGFVSLAFQSFQGCVQAFEFFSTAQHIGADADLFRTGLEFEKYRLISWAQRIGLGQNPRSTLNWQLAGLLLGQLESFLTSAETLKTRYSLEVSEEIVLATDKSLAAQVPKVGIAKLIARLKPSIYTTAGKIIQENNSTFKRLRWATRDRDKLKRFLGEIAELVNKLELLLDRAEGEAERSEYNRLLREVISLTSTTSEAGQIKELVGQGPYPSSTQASIRAAAHLKQIRLVLGADQRPDEVKGRVTDPSEVMALAMPKLPVLKRKLEPWKGERLELEGLEFANYKGKQVLIQWKIAEGAQWDKYKEQMKCLAVLLMSLSDKSFRSLPCMGYYPMESNGRHGVVYGTPDNSVDWTFKSLRDLILEQRLVSLRRRLAISRAIAETILQLHTAGWMHKSLRSSNIIFLAPRGSGSQEFLKSEPYLVSYDYARPDMAEAAKAFTQMPETTSDEDLYRHPQARGANRETYQKRFDMYALACVLVELVSWDLLINLHSKYTKKGLVQSLTKAIEANAVLEMPSLEDLLSVKDALELFCSQGGEKIVEIITCCLTTKEVPADENGLLNTQVAVVEQLSWFRV